MLEGEIHIKEFNHNVAQSELVSQPSDLIRRNHVKEITHKDLETTHITSISQEKKKKRTISVENITSLHLYPYPKIAANKFLRDHSSTMKFTCNTVIPHVQYNTHHNTTIINIFTLHTGQ
jgi:hypothetical protein